MPLRVSVCDACACGKSKRKAIPDAATVVVGLTAGTAVAVLRRMFHRVTDKLRTTVHEVLASDRGDQAQSRSSCSAKCWARPTISPARPFCSQAELKSAAPAATATAAA